MKDKFWPLLTNIMTELLLKNNPRQMQRIKLLN